MHAKAGQACSLRIFFNVRYDVDVRFCCCWMTRFAMVKYMETMMELCAMAESEWCCGDGKSVGF